MCLRKKHYQRGLFQREQSFGLKVSLALLSAKLMIHQKVPPNQVPLNNRSLQSVSPEFGKVPLEDATNLFSDVGSN